MIDEFLVDGLGPLSNKYRDLINIAESTLGYSLSRIISGGPEGLLLDTSIAQPAVTLASLLRFLKLKASLDSTGEKYQLAMAGHSVGEYAALAASEALSVGDTFKLIVSKTSLLLRLPFDFSRQGEVLLWARVRRVP